MPEEAGDATWTGRRQDRLSQMQPEATQLRAGPAVRRQRQEAQMFKIILGSIGSLRPAGQRGGCVLR